MPPLSIAAGGGPGKRLLRLRIINDDDGGAPGWKSGGIRTAVPYVLNFVPLLSIVLSPANYLWAIWDPKKQTWHDKAAGTVVISKES
jgi:uncharacterized RDD family membrane protein YckC